MIRRGSAVLALAYALTTTGAAAQQAEVRGAITETLAAWADGDFTRFASFYHPDVRGFFLDGGPLLERIDAAALQSGYDAGVRASFTLRDLEVRMQGDVAVSVAYLDGSLTLPGGIVRQGTWRYTETRVPVSGTWKVIQFHFSDFTPPGR